MTFKYDLLASKVTLTTADIEVDESPTDNDINDYLASNPTPAGTLLVYDTPAGDRYVWQVDPDEASAVLIEQPGGAGASGTFTLAGTDAAGDPATATIEPGDSVSVSGMGQVTEIPTGALLNIVSPVVFDTSPADQPPAPGVTTEPAISYDTDGKIHVWDEANQAWVPARQPCAISSVFVEPGSLTPIGTPGTFNLGVQFNSNDVDSYTWQISGTSISGGTQTSSSAAAGAGPATYDPATGAYSNVDVVNYETLDIDPSLPMVATIELTTLHGKTCTFDYPIEDDGQSASPVTTASEVTVSPAVNLNEDVQSVVEDHETRLDANTTKLDGIEDGATADQTGAEIKVAYEAEADTNAYTDSEKSKLAGMESNATADQVASEVALDITVNSETHVQGSLEDHEIRLDALEGAGPVVYTASSIEVTPAVNGEVDVQGSLEDHETRLDTNTTKLAGIETGATADQTGAEIKASYEAESDTNAYTDDEKSKLTGVGDKSSHTASELVALSAAKITAANTSRWAFRVSDRADGHYEVDAASVASPHTYSTDRYTSVDRYGLDLMTTDGYLFKRVGDQTITPQMFGAKSLDQEDADQSADFARMIQLAQDVDLVTEYGLKFHVPAGLWRVDSTVELWEVFGRWSMDGVFWAPKEVDPFKIVSVRSQPRDPTDNSKPHQHWPIEVAAMRELATGGQPAWGSDTSTNKEWKALDIEGISESSGTYTVTVTNHGIQDGSVVEFEDVRGMTQLNGNSYTTANATHNTFEITDTAGHTAYSWGGKVVADRAAWVRNTDVAVSLDRIWAADIRVKFAGNCKIGVRLAADYSARTFKTVAAPDGTAWAVGDTITGQSSGKTAVITKVVSGTEYRIKDYPGGFTASEHFQNASGSDAQWDNTITAYSSASQGNEIKIDETKACQCDILLGTYNDVPALSASQAWCAANEIHYRDQVGGSQELPRHMARYHVISTAAGPDPKYPNTTKFTGNMKDSVKRWTMAEAVGGISLPSASPVVITANGHGVSDGDVVKFTGVGGTTELNGNEYVVESATANTFALSGTDGDNFTAWTSSGKFTANWNSAIFLIDRGTSLESDTVRIEDNMGTYLSSPIWFPSSSPQAAVNDNFTFWRTTPFGAIRNNQRGNHVRMDDARYIRPPQRLETIAQLTPADLWYADTRVYLPWPWQRRPYNASTFYDYLGSSGSFGNNAYLEAVEEPKWMYLDTNGRQHIGIQYNVIDIDYPNEIHIITPGTASLCISAWDSSGTNLDAKSVGFWGNINGSVDATVTQSATGMHILTGPTNSTSQSLYLSADHDIAKLFIGVRSPNTNVDSITIQTRGLKLAPLAPWRPKKQVNVTPTRGYWFLGDVISAQDYGPRVVRKAGVAVTGDWEAGESTALYDWRRASNGFVYQAHVADQMDAGQEPSHTTVGQKVTGTDGIEWECVGQYDQAEFGPVGPLVGTNGSGDTARLQAAIDDTVTYPDGSMIRLSGQWALTSNVSVQRPLYFEGPAEFTTQYGFTFGSYVNFFTAGQSTPAQASIAAGDRVFTKDSGQTITEGQWIWVGAPDDGCATTNVDGSSFDNTNDDITVIVVDASDFSDRGTILIESEQCFFEKVDDTTLRIPAGGRGTCYTTAAAHADGTKIIETVSGITAHATATTYYPGELHQVESVSGDTVTIKDTFRDSMVLPHVSESSSIVKFSGGGLKNLSWTKTGASFVGDDTNDIFSCGDIVIAGCEFAEDFPHRPFQFQGVVNFLVKDITFHGLHNGSSSAYGMTVSCVNGFTLKDSHFVNGAAHCFTTSGFSSGSKRCGQCLNVHVQNVIARAGGDGIAFDTHPEGVDVVFENCFVTTNGVSGFSTRSRGTRYINCHTNSLPGSSSDFPVAGSDGFRVRGDNTQLINCSADGHLVGVHWNCSEYTVSHLEGGLVSGCNFKSSYIGVLTPTSATYEGQTHNLSVRDTDVRDLKRHASGYNGAAIHVSDWAVDTMINGCRTHTTLGEAIKNYGLRTVIDGCHITGWGKDNKSWADCFAIVCGKVSAGIGDDFVVRDCTIPLSDYPNKGGSIANVETDNDGNAPQSNYLIYGNKLSGYSADNLVYTGNGNDATGLSGTKYFDECGVLTHRTDGSNYVWPICVGPGYKKARNFEGDADNIVTEATASWTFAREHIGKHVRATAASAVTATLPADADGTAASEVAWDDDTEIRIEQSGAGQVTIDAGTGVTIHGNNGLKTAGQYGVVVLRKVGADEWVLYGDATV